MSPIRAEEKSRYPANWPEISRQIKERANWHCECRGECGLHADYGCQRYHGEPRVGKRSIVLTVAHLDHVPEHCDESNLKAMCEGCHNRYDLPRRIADRRKRQQKGTEPLFENAETT